VEGLLDETVNNVGYAQVSNASIRLGYLNPSYRLGLVGPGKELFPDTGPMVPAILLQLLYRHPIYPGGSPILFNPL